MNPDIRPGLNARRSAKLAFAILLAQIAGIGLACDKPKDDAPPPQPSPEKPAVKPDEPAPPPQPAFFREAAAATGIDFVHFTGATGEYFFPEIMGAGCALLDYDNDGDLDVYLLQGNLLDSKRTREDALFPPSGSLPASNRLFRNELITNGKKSDKLRFTDVTEASGTGDTGYAMGVATGDIDNDGFVDLFITNFGPDVLLRNNGDGTFTDITKKAGVGDPRWTTSAAFLDYNRDGRLDLFVVGYCDFAVESNRECFTSAGQRDYCNPRIFTAIPDRLYRNDGEGAFTDVSDEAGINAAYGHGLGVVAADFDGDGAQDIYVANDGDANQLWMNRGKRFEDTAMEVGAALNTRGMAEAGMGIGVHDIDHDGDADFMVTHLHNQTNTLYLNEGRFFRDATMQCRLGLVSRPYTGFGIAWFDVDHDGDDDLFIVNGDVETRGARSSESYPYRQPNQLLIQEEGMRFSDATGRITESSIVDQASRGLAIGDIDLDGDLDLLISNNNGPARLLLRELDDRANWLTVKTRLAAGKTAAIGAHVSLTLSDGRRLTRRVGTDGSYCSARGDEVFFAWPADVSAVELAASGPGYQEKNLQSVKPQQTLTLELTEKGPGA